MDVTDLPTVLERVHPAGARSEADLATLRALASAPVWYHRIDLGDGIVTNGVFDVAATVDTYGLEPSYAGRRVLDVGASNGFYSIEFARRGAAEVVALDLPRWQDHDWSPRQRAVIAARPAHEQATTDSITLSGALRIAAKASGVDTIRCESLRIYDATPERLGLFDVVFSGAMLMHVRDPLLGLHALRSVTKPDGRLILSASTLPSPDGSATATFAGAWDQCNFWRLSPECLVRLLDVADFELEREPVLFDLRSHDGTFVDPHVLVHARPKHPEA